MNLASYRNISYRNSRREDYCLLMKFFCYTSTNLGSIESTFQMQEKTICEYLAADRKIPPDAKRILRDLSITGKISDIYITSIKQDNASSASA
ncbi:hypothetical protein P029_03255 [Anaplasma phagocytophilum str. Norway variant2]|uniref:Uncharacterized protein n=2 Tax=Anaplasma phagocytophilum TaxID=948 RepID=A0A168HD21_ANAPH|nr:hypothetical protein P029_03255 [Anaplasma phagocytophilum str. Norway variant2]